MQHGTFQLIMAQCQIHSNSKILVVERMMLLATELHGPFARIVTGLWVQHRFNAMDTALVSATGIVGAINTTDTAMDANASQLLVVTLCPLP